MTAALDLRRRALDVVRDQLASAVAARKCHACGCLQQTVAALAATSAAPELAGELEGARAAFVTKKYDCLGCAECWPAVAANAFADAFPGEAGGLDLCPTAPADARDGWPPLPGDYRALRFGAPVAVCTLDDDRLAAALAGAGIDELAIVGVMHTENLGIERLMKNVLANPNVRRLVLCGDDTRQAVGHLPGQSLLSLFEQGVDESGRIRGARGKRPVLKNVTRDEIDAFVRQVEPVARIGECDASKLADVVREAARTAPGRFEGARPSGAAAVEATEPRRLVPDPAGYFVVYPDRARAMLSVEHFTNAGVFTCAVEGRTPAAVYATLIERGLLTRLDHAAYLGRELARVERALSTGEAYVQDRAAGVVDGDAGATDCGCTHGCENRGAT